MNWNVMVISCWLVNVKNTIDLKLKKKPAPEGFNSWHIVTAVLEIIRQGNCIVPVATMLPSRLPRWSQKGNAITYYGNDEVNQWQTWGCVDQNSLTILRQWICASSFTIMFFRSLWNLKGRIKRSFQGQFIVRAVPAHIQTALNCKIGVLSFSHHWWHCRPDCTTNKLYFGCPSFPLFIQLLNHWFTPAIFSRKREYFEQN